MWTPSLVPVEQLFGARFPSKLNLMLACTKTLANIFNQLHRCLKGKAILIKDIIELDTLHEHVSNGTMPHNS